MKVYYTRDNVQNIDGFATAGQKMCNLVIWNCESSITL